MSMIEKCARALCHAKGINPDDCVNGSAWVNYGGSGMVCHRRAWEYQIGAARAVLSVLMEAEEEMMLEGYSYIANMDTHPDEFTAGWKAVIRDILNEEPDGRLPSGRAGGAAAPQPAPRSSPDGRSSLTQEGEA